MYSIIYLLILASIFYFLFLISDDWSVFTGNPVKFGLGCVSMLFDIVFIVQHYILYRHSEERNQPITNTATGTTDSDVPEVDIVGGDSDVIRVSSDHEV